MTPVPQVPRESLVSRESLYVSKHFTSVINLYDYENETTNEMFVMV